MSADRRSDLSSAVLSLRAPRWCDAFCRPDRNRKHKCNHLAKLRKNDTNLRKLLTLVAKRTENTHLYSLGKYGAIPYLNYDWAE